MAAVQELCGMFPALSMMQVSRFLTCAAPFSPFRLRWRRHNVITELCARGKQRLAGSQ
jgi:hypothetical protein